MTTEICPYHFRNANPVNQLITRDFIHRIFSKFQINAEITDLALYQRAFVHKSYVEPTEEQINLEPPLTKEEYDPNYPSWVKLQPEDYEILEFKGDSILGSIITDYITDRYPHQGEGFLTRLKTQLVRGTNLCILSKKLKFNRYLLLSSRYEEKGRNNNAVLEDVFEAFLGALFIDFKRSQGVGVAYQICNDLVLGLVQRYININQFARRQDNYKDLLLQYYHKNFSGANPRYCLISTHGPTNNRTFMAGVIDYDGRVVTQGEGTKLVFAEQAAAKEALKFYGQEVYSDSEEPVKELYSDSDSESL